ncbi:carbonic anhydrase, partial [Mycena vitilis]
MFMRKIPANRGCNVFSIPSHYRGRSFVAPKRAVEETTGERPQLPIALPPTKRLAIVTCMDARIKCADHFATTASFPHLTRFQSFQATWYFGGRGAHHSECRRDGVRDALRSLIISQRLLGTREIAVYHHTGCGMVTFQGSELKRLVKWAHPGDAACASQIDAIDFLEFNDLEKSVKDDVQFLRESPLIVEGTKITGWIHYLETGETTRV